MKDFNIIVAYLKRSRGIGLDGKLPWMKLRKDMQFFAETTTKSSAKQVNSVIMGRRTFESIRFKPLKNRVNVVVCSSTPRIEWIDGVPLVYAQTFKDAVNFEVTNMTIDKRFVIGGERMFEEAIVSEGCKKIFATEVEELEADRSDVKFPAIPANFKLISENITQDKNRELNFKVYENMFDYASQEYRYLEVLKDILERGELIKDRTGVGTRSLFNKTLTFDVKILNKDVGDPSQFIYQIPAITTKKLHFPSIIWELIWFLSGNTDVKWLTERGVNIWNGNSSREYLDSIGLNHVPTNNIGKGYGYQWINWGGLNINQIENIINTLKTNPASRRIVLSAWNVGQLSEMALPPCHMMYIFKVSDHENSIKTLNCQMIMRSNDMFLGSPFNILSLAMLTILISRCANMYTGEISVSITDSHIYENHIKQVKEQIMRTPYRAPTMTINKCLVDYNSLRNLQLDDFIIKNYMCHPLLKGLMAV